MQQKIMVMSHSIRTEQFVVTDDVVQPRKEIDANCYMELEIFSYRREKKRKREECDPPPTSSLQCRY